IKRLDGTPTVVYMLNIVGKRNSDDSTFINIGIGRNNVAVTPGTYSLPNYNTLDKYAVSIWYGTLSTKISYYSGGDEVYGPTVVISSMNGGRIKGTFSGKLGNRDWDTSKPNNVIRIKGRFNLPMKPIIK